MGRSADLPRVSGQSDGDDTGCLILHVDMDAFFASVEIKRRPELRGRPVVVGGSTRGVVAAASYEARKYGIRSAMPMSRALRQCPHAVVLPPDRAAYSAASEQVMAILRDVTPLVQPLSLDEAFLDVSGAVRAQGRPGLIAQHIRARVEAELGLTCSVGVAPTKFVAKLASARCKPDGMLVIPKDHVLDFLHPLPVTALWGVGARTEEPLRRLGIRTVGDLAATPVDTLQRAVGTAMAEHLSTLAHGVDPRTVDPHEIEKSVSADHTVDTDLTAEADVRRELLRLSAEVGTRLRAKQFVGRTVGIKIRFADFKTVTRVRTLPNPTDSTEIVYQVATELYRSLGLDRPRVRLVGVKCENLEDAGTLPEQLTFDDLFAAPPDDDGGRALGRGAGGSSAAGPNGRRDGRPGAGESPANGSNDDRGGRPSAGELVALATTTGAGASAPTAAPDGASAAGGAAGARGAAAAVTSGSAHGSARGVPGGGARPAARPRRTDAVIDAARRKFGPDAVGYGTLLGNPGGPRFHDRPVQAADDPARRAPTRAPDSDDGAAATRPE